MQGLNFARLRRSSLQKYQALYGLDVDDGSSIEDLMWAVKAHFASQVGGASNWARQPLGGAGAAAAAAHVGTHRLLGCSWLHPPAGGAASMAAVGGRAGGASRAGGRCLAERVSSLGGRREAHTPACPAAAPHPPAVQGYVDEGRVILDFIKAIRRDPGSDGSAS